MKNEYMVIVKFETTTSSVTADVKIEAKSSDEAAAASYEAAQKVKRLYGKIKVQIIAIYERVV